MNKEKKIFDVVIAGGGLIGTTLGCLLAKGGLSVAIIEKENPEKFFNASFDGRVSAISHFSYLVLKEIEAWEALEKTAQPILEIRVCEGQSPMFVHFDYEEVSDKPLGYMIENLELRKALYNVAKNIPNISLISEKSVSGIENGNPLAAVVLDSGEKIEAPLIVAADGRFSKIRAMAGIKHMHVNYKQSAIVFAVEHEKPHYGVAVENFLPSGPFAILPMKENKSAIVWTEKEQFVKDYLALSDDEFKMEVEKRFEGYLGELKVLPGRWSYPLSLSHAEKYYAGRIVLVGDSAHGMHPIAGQGANVGFRDAAALAELLIKQKQLGLDLGAQDILQKYQQWRRFDSFTMAAVTDGLTRLFSNNILPISLARRTGMGVVNKIPPAKRFLMKHAMGMLGKLPETVKKQDQS